MSAGVSATDSVRAHGAHACAGVDLMPAPAAAGRILPGFRGEGEGAGVARDGEGTGRNLPFLMNFSSVVSWVTWLSISPMAFRSWLHSHGRPAGRGWGQEEDSGAGLRAEGAAPQRRGVTQQTRGRSGPRPRGLRDLSQDGHRAGGAQTKRWGRGRDPVAVSECWGRWVPVSGTQWEATPH